MAAPRLCKRPWDLRLFDVDVAGKLRDGAAITAVDSVTAEALGLLASPAAAVTISEVAFDGTVVQFLCGAGSAGEDYRVTIRYVSDVEPQLETSIVVEVRADA